MKTRILAFLLLCVVGSTAQEKPVSPYPVQLVTDTARLASVLAAVNAARLEEDYAARARVENVMTLVNKLGDNLWLANRSEKNVPPGAIARLSNSASLPQDSGLCAVRFPDGDTTRRADGDKITGHWIETGEIHEYRTVSGSVSNIRVWAVRPAYKAFTVEEMKAALKAGQKWIIPINGVPWSIEW